MEETMYHNVHPFVINSPNHIYTVASTCANVNTWYSTSGAPVHPSQAAKSKEADDHTVLLEINTCFDHGTYQIYLSIYLSIYIYIYIYPIFIYIIYG